ncbi:hypothetical protein EVG20_g8064 [Dentipellis fragilis]|uniref:Uncharacterized protein n=1 Tax=Dentipellis fragilis TaxID=205917 RepID=A0A4Y9YCR6_9AGAM|nr:hypothetical protein EVG20_g8064 [Dentipellis fragilis]
MSSLPIQARPPLTPPPILIDATRQFTAWVKQNAQGAEVILCGGLAFVQYGSGRVTQDADLCMDLSRTRRHGTQVPFDTNALKDMASRDPRFIVGPKIFWIHQLSGTPVQVDFVDTRLFWQPFDIRYMVDANPAAHAVPSLNPPMLLVGKMKSALERAAMERKINDIADFDYALTLLQTSKQPPKLFATSQT